MTIDRRSMSRHDMQLVCHIGPGHIVSKPVAGVVENISRGGMLMRWEEMVPLPEAGSSLVVEVGLPENSEYGARAMQCSTKVVRVITRAGRTAKVALRIEQIRFVDQSKARGLRILAATPVSRRVN
jgi:c-di-GMP-binding flagellar brake protein YcgR